MYDVRLTCDRSPEKDGPVGSSVHANVQGILIYHIVALLQADGVDGNISQSARY